MKKRNKLVSLLLTFAMILTMMVNIVVADDPAPEKYSITITNATIGKDYSVYRVFDIEESADGKNIYKVTTEWTEEKLPANCFTVSGGIVEATANDATIIDGFNKLTSLPEATASTGTDGATSATVVFSGLTPGYYYVKSSVGTIVSLVQPTKNNVEIIDKNQKPTWEPSDPDGPYYPDPDKPYDPYDPSNPENPDEPTGTLPPLGKFVWEATSETEGSWVKINDSHIGEELDFMINFYAPRYVGTNEVVAYTLTDKYGVEFENVNITAVEVDGVELTNGYTVIPGNGFFKVVLNMDKVCAALNGAYTKGNVSVTYKATLSDKATEENVNTASLNWTQVPYNPDNDYDTSTTTDKWNPEDPDDETNTLVPVDPSTGEEITDSSKINEDTIYTPVDTNEPKHPSDSTNPDSPQVPDRTPTKPDNGDRPKDTQTTTYTYTIVLKKVEQGTNVPLDATFNIKLNATGNPLVFTYDEENKIYTLAENGSADIKAGTVTIKGLDAASYTFYETVVPDKHVGLSENGQTEIIKSLANGVAGAVSTVYVTIENPKKGSLLPTTGGVGTTIFYIVGSILVIGAGVLLVSRKRARH